MLEDADRATAGFYAIGEGTLTFELVVSDGNAESTPESVQVQVLPGEPDQARPPQGSSQAQSDGGGGGCSIGMGARARHATNTTDIGYLATLFLPAIGALAYQRRRLRKGKRLKG